jgi:hypothetical protein
MNDFKDVDQLKENMERILRDFSDYLSSSAAHGQIELKIKSCTPYTLTFLLRCASDWSWFEVDLLPIVDVWSTCKYDVF